MSSTRSLRVSHCLFNRNCGLDDTCVFCSRCFHATNHDGHDILFSVSPGSGGCCDCGDEEAWKVPLQCQIHTSEDQQDTNRFKNEPGLERLPLDPQLVNAIRSTIASVLNFLLDTFALAPEEVALNSSTEELVRENQEQRTILSRMGIPSQLQEQRQADDTPMDNVEQLISMEEDVDMDKENGDFKKEDKCLHVKAEEAAADGELYACIAWNDEAHAFSHVLESIMTATGWDWEKAKQIVDVIHVHGREIIAVSKDITELRKIAAPLSAINLGVTIRPAKETFREQVCGLLVDWLNELVNGRERFFTDIENGDAVIRNILCEELCAEWELRLPLALLTSGSRTTNLAHEDGDEDSEYEMKDDLAMSSSTSRPNNATEDVEMFDREANTATKDSPESFSSTSPIIYRNQCDVASIEWDPAAMVREYQHLRNQEVEFGEALCRSTALGKKPVTDNSLDEKDTAFSAMSMQKEFEEKLRLDYFMLYDLKLWKEVRISLRELYIASLASSPRFKKILGKRLARNYARLAESFLLRDREPENSIILFSVQLLTVPTVSDLLVHNYYFFGLICSTLTAFFLTDRLYLLLPSERSKYSSRINCESRAFRTRRYFNAFHDLRYIMNVDMIKSVLAQDPLYLRQYLDLISLFQGMNAQVCQKDTHVEYESEIWVNAFNVTLQIAKCCRQFSDCFSMLPNNTADDKLVAVTTIVRAVSRILKKIEEWGKKNEEEEAAEQEKRVNSLSGTVQPPAPKIYGACEQVFHTVDLDDNESYEVIEYNVATQPVSFHHPLHWLLSGLLEYAYLLDDNALRQAGWDGGFKQVITLFTNNNDPSDTLLRILDFPVRTIVFSSQIRAGVWVRNGYGIRNQVKYIYMYIYLAAKKCYSFINGLCFIRLIIIVTSLYAKIPMMPMCFCCN
jgi:E3 ubiquitin-protein ligase UBR1